MNEFELKTLPTNRELIDLIDTFPYEGGWEAFSFRAGFLVCVDESGIRVADRVEVYDVVSEEWLPAEETAFVVVKASNIASLVCDLRGYIDEAQEEWEVSGRKGTYPGYEADEHLMSAYVMDIVYQAEEAFREYEGLLEE